MAREKESFIQIYRNTKCYRCELTFSEFFIRLLNGIVNLTANNWFHSYFDPIFWFISLFSFRFVVASPVLLVWAHVSNLVSCSCCFSLYYNKNKLCSALKNSETLRSFSVIISLIELSMMMIWNIFLIPPQMHKSYYFMIKNDAVNNTLLRISVHVLTREKYHQNNSNIIGFRFYFEIQQICAEISEI